MRKISITGVFAGLVFATFTANAFASPMEGDTAQQHAAEYLKSGQPKTAYSSIMAYIEGTSPIASDLVLAARAALERVKSAPLLSKKKWVRRGKSHYQAALALDPENVDAVMGLATLALRAPKKLGGGAEDYTRYKAQLNAIDPARAQWLEGRAFAEQQQFEPALSAYSAAAKSMSEQRLFEEYAALAQSKDTAAEAYAILAGSDRADAPCVERLLGTLAQRADASAAQTLEHYDAFLASGTRFCNRKAVAAQVAEQAALLAERYKLTEKSVDYQAQLAALRAQDGKPSSKPDVAS